MHIPHCSVGKRIPHLRVSEILKSNIMCYIADGAQNPKFFHFVIAILIVEFEVELPHIATSASSSITYHNRSECSLIQNSAFERCLKSQVGRMPNKYS